MLSPGFIIPIRLAMAKLPSSKHFTRVEVASPDIAVISGSHALQAKGRFERQRRSRLFLESSQFNLS